MRAVTRRRIGNLPTETSSFVGRSGDIVAAGKLLSRARLVTLTGGPGVGKTRLALEVARRYRRRFPDGIWLVEFAPVQDEALVAHTIAQAIGLRLDTGADPMALICEHLRGRQALLVWDNGEHVAGRLAATARPLLAATERLRILATSRHTLRAIGEQVWEVLPLPVLPGHGRHAPHSVPAAVELFRQRASAVVPTFTVNGDNAIDVVAACRRLDGIPLAIELAAARLRTMSVRELAIGLDDRFELLTGAAEGPVAHHRTLRTTVDWSFELCDPAERTLWARLSVFAGAFDLGAAEDVGAGGRVGPADTMDLLDGLVDKSIVVAREEHGTVRYRMLETLRQYGAERLRAAGEERERQSRHAQRFLRVGEQGEREWFSRAQPAWLERLAREHDDMRAALQFLTTSGDAEAALRLAAGLWFHWVFSGRVAEGRFWLDRALALSAEPTVPRGRALWASAFLGGLDGDLGSAQRLAEEAVAVAEAAGDPLTAARATTRIGILRVYAGDPAAGEPLLAETVHRLAQLGEHDNPTTALTYMGLSMARLGVGDIAGATVAGQRAESLSRHCHDDMVLAFTLNLLGRVSWLAGDLDGATGRIREAVQLRGSATAPVALATAAEQLAWIAATSADHNRSAVLLGAADRLWRTFALTSLHESAFFEPYHVSCVDRVRQALGERIFTTVFDSGRELTVEQIVDRLVQLPPVPVRTGNAGPAAPQ